MSFSLSNFIHTCYADARAVAVEVAKDLGIVATEVDKYEPTIAKYVRLADPVVADAMDATKALIDEFHALAPTSTAADGSVTFTVSPPTATALKKAGQDGISWLASIGIKL